MLKNPTDHAAAAPALERDLRLTPRAAITVATKPPMAIAVALNGSIVAQITSGFQQKNPSLQFQRSDLIM